MKKWKKAFKKYLDSKSKKKIKRTNGKIPLDFFGTCVLFKPGEMAAYKESLEVDNGICDRS